MARNIFYSGSFLSRKGHTIKVDILKEGTPTSVGDLSFPAESPLTIEWSSDSKKEIIQGSTATLTVISPGDRTYLDLYTTEVGSVRLNVYRDNALYWSGSLDTEFYEEPFTSARDYDVTLTFSDFGLWDRLKYNLIGLVSIDDILRDAISRSCTSLSGYTKHISTSMNGTTLTLEDVTILSDNFMDEDGEVKSVQEAVEGVLQPLDLHIRQYAGAIHVYDLNAQSKLTAETLSWVSDDQVLGVDEVANSVTVTFSPYANATVFSDEYTQYTGKVSTSDFESATRQGFLTMAGGSTSDGATTHAWYPDYSDRSNGQSDQDYQNLSFGLYTGLDNAKFSGLEYINPSVFKAKILPLLGGDEADCLMIGYWYSGHTHATSEAKQWRGAWKPGQKNATNMDNTKIFTAAQGNLFPDATGLGRVKIMMELLYDPRYNFSSSAGDDNEKGYAEDFTKKSSTIYVPVRIYVRDNSGNILCHYKNSDRCKSSDIDLWFNRDSYSSNTDGWIEGAPTGKTANTWECWLNWYKNSDDRAEDGGMDGWTMNSHAVGFKSTGKLAESFKQRNEGEIIPLPPHAGQLVIEVYKGVYVYDYKVSLNWGQDSSLSSTWLDDKIRWFGFKAPEVTLVNNDLKFTDVDCDDIEYTGTLLETAQDDISIDTICGTASKSLVGARGILRNSAGHQITEFTREGRTDTAEQLLIGTMHSHYATRHAVLSGTIALSNSTSLHLYRDTHLDVKMAPTSEVVDIIADENEIKIIETNLDKYTSL